LETVVPIYEYVCSACGKPFELLVRSQREERGVSCPHCGAARVERQFSVIATPRAAEKSPPPRSGPCQGCGNADGGCPYK
jgi:putative FmdB family regulatory protein